MNAHMRNERVIVMWENVTCSVGGGGGERVGVLPHMSYIGMCGTEGYGF